MWQSYSNGLLVAIGLIMAIGAQNAFVLAQSLRREHHLPVAALCILCDALLVAAGVFVYSPMRAGVMGVAAVILVALGYGLLRGRSYLQYVMDGVMPLTDAGWMILTRRVTAFFFALALANELVWRTMSTMVLRS